MWDKRMRKLTLVSISKLKESGENRRLYDPPSDSDIEQLAESIKKRGLLHEPVITKDRYIISGHRRIRALEYLRRDSVRCKIESITYKKNYRRFLKMLREANRQRIKKINEVIQEAIVDSSDKNTDQVYMEKLVSPDVDIEPMEIEGEKRRFQIKGNQPLLDASIKVINELRDYWPLSDRTIHYKLLNNPPRVHQSKPDIVYRKRKGELKAISNTYSNDKYCYKTLTDVLARARLTGLIPWEAIIDETRPFTEWRLYSDVSPFINEQLKGFMDGYYRNYCQSQPNCIEVLAEKLTLNSIIKPVAMRYRLPYTIGRGYPSMPARHDLVERFEASQKIKLICLILSDLDPDGDEIAQSFARSMRDDFDVYEIYPIKVALTWDQVNDLNLPSSPDSKAKKTSKNYGKYMDKYKTDDVWELEALTPRQLQNILDNAIRSVINVDLFNKEIEQEKKDHVELNEYRERVFKAIQSERR
jgi:hypothetical protein